MMRDIQWVELVTYKNHQRSLSAKAPERHTSGVGLDWHHQMPALPGAYLARSLLQRLSHARTRACKDQICPNDPCDRCEGGSQAGSSEQHCVKHHTTTYWSVRLALR